MKDKSLIIAKYFLCKSDLIRPAKLNALVYYSYAWYLNLYKEKLFNSRIYLDRRGCIVESIENEYKGFKYLALF